MTEQNNNVQVNTGQQQTTIKGEVKMNKQVAMRKVEVQGVLVQMDVNVFVEGVEQQVVRFGYSKLGGRQTYLQKDGEVKRVSRYQFVKDLKAFGIRNAKDLETAVYKLTPLYTRKHVTTGCKKCQKDVTAAEMDFIQRNYKRMGIGEFEALCMTCQPKFKAKNKRKTDRPKAPAVESGQSARETVTPYSISPQLVAELGGLELPKNTSKKVRQVIEALRNEVLQEEQVASKKETPDPREKGMKASGGADCQKQVDEEVAPEVDPREAVVIEQQEKDDAEYGCRECGTTGVELDVAGVCINC